MLTTLLNAAWMWQSYGEAKAFRRAMTQVRATQESLLRSTLRDNAGCQYGREFDFAGIGSLSEFQRRVPICDYESLQAKVDAIAAGQQGVLTTEPVEMLEPTGGSTGGGKLIPYTATLRRQFQRAIGAWMHDVLGGVRGVRGGRAYWSISPAAQRPLRTAGGIRIGFDHDAEYLEGWQRRIVSRLLAVPTGVAQLRNVENFQYATLLSLLATEDLALISIWSPTFLTALFEKLSDWHGPISADLESGRVTWPRPECCSEKPTFHGLRKVRRSRQLRRLFAEHGVTPDCLSKCWPGLSLLSAWGDAAAAMFVPALRRWLPNVPFHPKGLLATEGMVSFPLLGRTGAALAIRSHVFEFLPSEDAGTRDQRPLWAWELALGTRYRVLLTTGGGLYRYDLGDEVETVGRMAQCPLLKFIGRGRVGCDLVGEKLHEQHVRRAILEGCSRLGVECGFALAMPVAKPSSRYRVCLVSANWMAYSSQRHMVERALALEIERELCANPQYQYAVQLGQLRPLEVWLLDATPEQAWDVFEEDCRRRGQKVGDIKPTTLVQEADCGELFGAYHPR